jgi:hypothetical protein
MIEHPERAELSCVAHTDAGMLAIWDPASFATVVDYDTWEVALLDDKDIIGHVGQGGLVPICIGADGAWGVTLRVGTGDQRADLTEREKQYLIVSSEPYLFVSAGLVCVSGLEAITAEPDEAVSRLAMPIGRFVAMIHLIDWAEEPGAKNDRGEPTARALADFVVLLNHEIDEEPRYRTRIETFERSAAVGDARRA